MKDRIDLTEIPEEMSWEDNKAVVVRENGWFKADMNCTTKSVKVALNRFFKAVPELESWRETMESETKFHDEDCGVHFEIDTANAYGEFPTVYIFLNVNEKARDGLN